MHPFLESAPHPLPWAHRGGAKLPGNESVENTLVAFQRAHDLGYRYLETDVHASADGVPFAFHDLNMQRLTGKPTAIADVTSDVIDAVRLGGTEPIPRLADFLETFGDCWTSIDVKDDRAVEPTIAAIEAAGARDRVCLGSFSHERLVRLRRALPDVCTSMSPREIGLLRLSPVAPVGGDFASVPRRRGRLEIVTPGFVRRAHRRGIPVHVWTIDDRARMRSLLDLGIDGLFTDRPDLLRDVLVERDEWRHPA